MEKLGLLPHRTRKRSGYYGLQPGRDMACFAIAAFLIMLTESKVPVVLLVEDSEDDAFFFSRTLQKSGMSCSLKHVTDGAQAIDFLRSAVSSGNESIPHTVFLDLKMPVLNGFEVLDWMRMQVFPVPINVIVLSGSEHQEDQQRASQLGAAEYLVKPVRVNDLHRLLRNICPQEMGAPI